MVGLVQNVLGHMAWFDYYIGDLSDASKEINKDLCRPPGEIDKNMVDEDRTILMGEKMNMHVLHNIRSCNNQRSLAMFTCSSHGQE